MKPFGRDNGATSFVFCMFHMFFVCAFLFRLLHFCGVLLLRFCMCFWIFCCVCLCLGFPLVARYQSNKLQVFISLCIWIVVSFCTKFCVFVDNLIDILWVVCVFYLYHYICHFMVCLCCIVCVPFPNPHSHSRTCP